MLQAKKGTKKSVYTPRKSQKDIHLKYADDGKSKDIGPAMIILKDEDVRDDDDKIDSPFPTAFSPTFNYSLDINLDLALSGDEKPKETKLAIEEAAVYSEVLPKSQRPENALETSDDIPVSNGVTITVDPHSQYAKVIPKSQRNHPAGNSSNSAVANGKPASNGIVPQSDNRNLKAVARSKVLSAIGSEPIVIRNDDDEVAYRRNVPTAKRIESVLESKVTYRESAEL